MSRTRVITLVAAFLFAGMGSAHAQIRPGAFTFTPLVGGYLFEGDQNLDHKPLFGAALGMDLSKCFGVEAMLNYVDTKNYARNDDVDAYVYHLDGLFYFRPDKKLVPYFAVGTGGITLNPAGAQESTDWLVDYGVGLKYFVTDNLAIRGDVRHLISFDDTYNNLSYALGLTFQWGGAKPARAEAAPIPVAAPEKVVAAPSKKEVCVYLDVYFAFDRAEIDPRYEDQIRRVADFMKANPDVKAAIKGYTDYIGTEEYNEKLSELRAESVKNYLVDKFGIDASRIAIVGLGQAHPRATNETAFGRQLNRRASDAVCTFQIIFK